MGYKAQRQVYKLVFDDEDMAGFVVRAFGMKFGEALDLGELAELDGKKVFTAEDMERVRPVFDMFIRHVIEWNLEDDDDQPVPVTVDALLDNDMAWVMKVVDAWMRVATAVPAPLAKPSSDGEPSPVPPLMMEALSPSLAS